MVNLTILCFSFACIAYKGRTAFALTNWGAGKRSAPNSFLLFLSSFFALIPENRKPRTGYSAPERYKAIYRLYAAILLVSTQIISSVAL